MHCESRKAVCTGNKSIYYQISHKPVESSLPILYPAMYAPFHLLCRNPYGPPAGVLDGGPTAFDNAFQSTVSGKLQQLAEMMIGLRLKAVGNASSIPALIHCTVTECQRIRNGLMSIFDNSCCRRSVVVCGLKSFQLNQRNL